MRTLILIFLVLISATLFAEWLMLHPGHILIYYGGKEFGMSLSVALVTLSVATILLYGTLSFLRQLVCFPSRYRRSLKIKSNKNFSSAFMAYVLGDNDRAERLYLRGARHGDFPEAHYIAAAEIAHKRGNIKRRDRHVESAISLYGTESLATVKQAQWLLEERKLEQVESVLEKIPVRMQRQPNVLRIRGEVYFEKGDFEQLISLLPELSNRKIFDESRFEELQLSAYVNYLVNRSKNSVEAEIQRAWKDIPRKIKNKRRILSTYVGILFKAQRYSEAEKLLRKRIESEWDAHLVALYGEIQTKTPQKILKKLESWSIGHEDDPGLGIAKARQYMQAQMWGRARGVISSLLDKNPSPTLYKLLADIDEKLGDEKKSLNNRRAGLELATDLRPEQ